jgi:small subunit ribosomal protein S20
MAITSSAKKAHRQSVRRKKLNDTRRTALRGAIKAVREAGKGDAKTLAGAYKAIDKAVKRGLMTKNTAARRKSKLARMLKAK